MLFNNKTEQTKKYVVGFDLQDDFCQMSYYLDDTRIVGREPVTYSTVKGQENFDIPAVLCKKTGTNQWFCGKEAQDAAQRGEGTLVVRLLSQALDGRPVHIEDADYDPAALLSLFINRCLLMLGPAIPIEQILAVMFTVEPMSDQLISILESVRERLRIPAEFAYQSYGASFYDYLLIQPEEFREKSVLMCEWKEDRPLRIRKMIYNKRTTPIVAFQEEQEYPPLERADLTLRDEQFNKILDEQYRSGTVISAAYLIGDGFKGNWMKTSLLTLCRAGRVFQGNNLFGKGAAIGALLRIKDIKGTEKYFFLSDDKLKCNVGIRAYAHGQEVYLPLVDAGMPWYDVHSQTDIILENENELQLILTPLTGQKPDSFLIRLENLPKREGRCTRLRLTFNMTGVRRLHLIIEDLGFGEIFPATGYKWEQNITLRQ